MFALLLVTFVTWHGEAAKTRPPLTIRAAKAAIIAAHASRIGACWRMSGRSVYCNVIVAHENEIAHATLTTGRRPNIRVVFRHYKAMPDLKPRS
jgi:hypothetical protein